MRKFSIRIFILAALAGLAAGPGCGGDSAVLSAETDESAYREAHQLEKQGRTEEALASYLKVIAKRGDQAPESHLNAGLIYLERMKDPIAAIYYFRKYLEQEPNSRQSVYVRGLVDTAKREFARTLPAQPLDNQAPRLDMLDQVDRLQRENDALKAELAAVQGGGAPLPHTAGSGPALLVTPPSAPSGADEASHITAAPLPDDNEAGIAPDSPKAAHPAASVPTRPSAKPAAGSHAHTVAKGDTLFSLAQRYYGNRSKWRDILAANRDQLPGENAQLRIGMVLKIP